MKNLQRGSVYIVGLIFIFLTAVFIAGILLITSVEYRHVIRDQWSLTALHLAEAGVEDAVWALKNFTTTQNWIDAHWSTGTAYTKTVLSFKDSTGETIGDYDVSITNPASAAPIVESTGYSPGKTASHKIERTVKVGTGQDTGNIVAAITTNYVTETKGNIVVDGRNHDSNGNLLTGGSGTLAIYTTSSYSREGNSKVAGTDSGTDYEPSKTYNPPNIVTESGTWPGSYPGTPDAVMKYTAGTLIAMAQSSGQYVTDPSLLTTPLSGVTYVDYSGTWNASSFDFTGTGVLVVHSSSGYTACIKNLNTGTFKGLIIADDIIHIHNTIIGAVFVLSPNPPEGNCIGNGNGNVLYSSQAVDNAFNASGKPGTAIVSTWQER